MQLLDLVALVRQVGYVVVARLLLRILWLVTPFLVWAAIYTRAGGSWFVLTYAIPGVVLTLIACISTSCQTYFITCFEFGLMKRIEHCGQIFRNPADPDVIKQYSEECEKLVLPYVYHYPIVTSGLLRTFYASGSFLIVEVAVSLYTSYSVFTFAVRYQLLPRVLAISGAIAAETSSLAILALSWAYANLTPILIVLLVVSFCFQMAQSRNELGAFGVSAPSRTLLSAMMLFAVEERLLYISRLIGKIPQYVKRDYIAHYRPFVGPSMLQQIIQGSVSDVEGKPCSVTSFSQKLTCEADAKRVLELFTRDRRMPAYFRFMASSKSFKQVIETTELSRPIFYLGTLDDRCLLAGILFYKPSERVREGYFYFDNIHIRKEFMLIMNKAVEKQREAMVGVPAGIDEIVRTGGQTGGR